MSNALVGMGLFVRPPTERTPRPTSVAVDLGLGATVPQAGRPWACRVAAALIRPGANGLATHVVDVERLTELGRAAMGRLGNSAVLAAVVTTGGRRTWLVYAAGDDLTAVTAAVRQAVRLSFAEQADYVPVVTVEHDPDWSGYRSLYPTPAELADLHQRRAEAAEVAAVRLATDAAVAAGRRRDRSGAEPPPSATVRYRLSFPTDTARSVFLSRAFACQFRPAVPVGPRLASATPTSDAGPVSAEIDRDGLIDAAAIHQIERWLMAEARRVGGRYVGWDVAAQAAAMRLAA